MTQSRKLQEAFRSDAVMKPRQPDGASQVPDHDTPSGTDSTIPAIPTPTVFKGHRYRSRLEARWAAFFGRLRWTFAYEPCDLGAWSPDFLILDQLLVAVTPFRGLTRTQQRRIGDAAVASPFLRVLLCPEPPKPCEQNSACLGHYGLISQDSEHAWGLAVVRKRGRQYGLGFVLMTEPFPKDSYGLWDEIAPRWEEAATLVQPGCGR